MKHEQVEELQGLYGPFSMQERAVQKVWLRRDFEQDRLQLADGREVSVRFPGRWNLLGGPDFREARLAIDGASVAGDIEVHFHSADWHAHRHAEDPAYDRVVLHVVLFPPDPTERRAVRRDGSEIPTLVLLPILNRSLEEYASDEALEKMTHQDAAEKISELAALPRPEVVASLRGHAQRRWEMKVRFARLRLDKLGWTAAAHHAALEIFGYRRNRAPMLATATAHPLAEWIAGLDPVAVFRERFEQWETQGIRPANFPLRRLQQYRRWVSARPDWTATLCQIIEPAKDAGAALDTVALRKARKLGAIRSKWAEAIADNQIGGSRFDTMICDAFLPLVAAETEADLASLWFHWFLGDVPDDVRKALSILGLAGVPDAPFCHGWAQGFLGWLTEREVRASC